MKTPKIGLALGSGVARGWAHIGVLQALKQHGIVPDLVCGTSIGALIGGMQQAGKLDEVEAFARGLKRNRLLRYLDVSLTGGGLISGKKLSSLVEEALTDTQIEDLSHPFAAITTELGTGHEIWLRSGKLSDAIAASYALPGLFPPRRLDGRWLIDGALTNPVPVSVCRALGARLVIAVNLNADVFGMTNVGEDRFDKEENVPMEFAYHSQSSLNMMKHKFFSKPDNTPSMFGVMLSSLNIVQDRLSRSRLAGDPPDVTVAPRLARYGLLEFDKADEMIEEGIASVERAMPFLRHALTILS